MVIMISLRTNSCWKSFTPSVNSRIDNVPVFKIAPDLNQPIFQSIKVADRRLSEKHVRAGSSIPDSQHGLNSGLFRDYKSSD